MKKCKNCAACREIYRMGAAWFYLEKYYCADREEMTDAESVCEKWRQKKVEFDFSTERFDELEGDIRYIKNYVKRLD